MIDPQLIAQLQTQIAALGRRLEGVALGVKQTKERSEMLSRMLSFHHFALLAIIEATPPDDALRQKIKDIAKRFKIKLLPTDPEYKNEVDNHVLPINTLTAKTLLVFSCAPTQTLLTTSTISNVTNRAVDNETL